MSLIKHMLRKSWTMLLWLTVVQILLDIFCSTTAGVFYAAGFLIGMTYQGLCDDERREAVINSMKRLLYRAFPQCVPRPNLKLLKSDVIRPR